MTPTQKGLIATGTLGVLVAAGLGLLPEEYTWEGADDDEEGIAEAGEDQPSLAQDDEPEPLRMERDPDAPPNIVVLVADDLAPSDFGFGGSETARTPRIDALASESAVFTDAYAVAPVCSPARAGILGGRYPQRFGHEFDPPPHAGRLAGLPLQVHTLGDHLHDHGYQTAAIGKWHLGRHKRFHPSQRGFDHFFGFLAGSRTHLPADPPKPRRLQRNSAFVAEDFTYLSDRLTDEAVDWIDDNALRPFFLYVSLPLVQPPLEALQDDLDAQADGLQGNERRRAAMTAALDRSVGRILDALEEHEVREESIVFFTSDDGPGETLREASLHVPLLVHWPSELPAGEHVGIASTLDIVPTAMGAARLPQPVSDGSDLLPWIRGERDTSPHKLLFWRFGELGAIRADDMKLHITPAGTQLFDLSSDPEESTDIAARQPGVVTNLTKRFEAWSWQMADPLFGSAGDDDSATRAPETPEPAGEPQ